MAQIKALAPSAEKAIQRVLKQQKTPHWDSDAHRAATGYLAEAFFADGAFDRKGFTSALGSEPWDYASNMKKRLASLELIPASEDLTAAYE